MQPLSYQVLPMSCWVTSMPNGIIFLLEDNKKVPLLAYRLLHELLVEEGVSYYTKKQKMSFAAIITAVSMCTDLDIKYHTEGDVETVIDQLHFNRQVAVCDVDAGEHSILLSSMKNGWLNGFDPYWASVKGNQRADGLYETYAPFKQGTNYTINVQINKDHLLRKRWSTPYQMGAASSRFITVLTKPSS